MSGYNPDFIKQRARQVVENRQDNFQGKSFVKEGFGLDRLVHPQIDQVNDDFFCAICQSKSTFISPDTTGITLNFLGRNRQCTP